VLVDDDRGRDLLQRYYVEYVDIARQTGAAVQLETPTWPASQDHEELDAATELDEGDPTELTTAQDALRPRLPNLALIGGCCGTDARHIAAMWGVAQE
jgi:S-methylmethionine-dependent homocysteine/selenocysteine methylase